MLTAEDIDNSKEQQRRDRLEEQAWARYELRQMRSANKPPKAVFNEPSAPSGMFWTRYGNNCGDCQDYIRKGDLAGYNSDDEVVCEDCFVPFNER